MSAVVTAAGGPITDNELRDLWRAVGGTIFDANREIGTMPTAKLLPLMRTWASPDTLRTVLAARSVLEQRVAEMTEDELQDFLDWRDAGRPPAKAAAAAPAPAPSAAERTPNNAVIAQYGSALDALVQAVLPGLPLGNLLEDARKAVQAMGEATPAGFFVLDDETDPESPRIAQVKDENAGDEDVFPLFRRAPRRSELPAANDERDPSHELPAAAAAPARRKPGPKPRRTPKGGAA